MAHGREPHIEYKLLNPKANMSPYTIQNTADGAGVFIPPEDIDTPQAILIRQLMAYVNKYSGQLTDSAKREAELERKNQLLSELYRKLANTWQEQDKQLKAEITLLKLELTAEHEAKHQATVDMLQNKKRNISLLTELTKCEDALEENRVKLLKAHAEIADLKDKIARLLDIKVAHADLRLENASLKADAASAKADAASARHDSADIRVQNIDLKTQLGSLQQTVDRYKAHAKAVLVFNPDLLTEGLESLSQQAAP
jgi:chromosome segregation ATPase